MQRGGVDSARAAAGLAVDGYDLLAQSGKTLVTQHREAASNCPGSMSPKIRPKVSCDGMPWI
jgi:hypothetical protein